MRPEDEFLSTFSILTSRKSFYRSISYGRQLLLKEFVKNVAPLVGNRKIIEVCVVGGYSSEPEIQILRDMGYLIKVTTFGIDHSDHFLDLNVISAYDSDFYFDLILFSQTLEHIWSHASAFANISNIAKSKSLLWVSCPTSNRYHGSPDYYSAGFMPEYLEKNLEEFGFSILSSGKAGSVRNYLATHLLPYWLSVKAHFFPLSVGAESYQPKSRVMMGVITFPVRFILTFIPGWKTQSPRWATESWALFIAK